MIHCALMISKNRCACSYSQPVLIYSMVIAVFTINKMLVRPFV